MPYQDLAVGMSPAAAGGTSGLMSSMGGFMSGGLGALGALAPLAGAAAGGPAVSSAPSYSSTDGNVFSMGSPFIMGGSGKGINNNSSFLWISLFGFGIVALYLLTRKRRKK